MFKKIWKHQLKNKDITQFENNIVNSSPFICLSKLPCGESAKVIKLQGNPALVGKLKAMGIFAGSIIFKKSAIPAKGSIIVEKSVMQFALGYNIAENILVERLSE